LRAGRGGRTPAGAALVALGATRLARDGGTTGPARVRGRHRARHRGRHRRTRPLRPGPRAVRQSGQAVPGRRLHPRRAGAGRCRPPARLLRVGGQRPAPRAPRALTPVTLESLRTVTYPDRGVTVRQNPARPPACPKWVRCPGTGVWAALSRPDRETGGERTLLGPPTVSARRGPADSG